MQAENSHASFVVGAWGLSFDLDGTGGDHVHRAEDDLPRKVEGSPEVAVEYAERARITPDGADGARERHECAHLVAGGARSEVRGDLGRGDVGKGASLGAGAASAGGGEHGGGHWEECGHETVEAVRDEEGVQRGERLGVRNDERHYGDGDGAAGAHLRARDGQTRDVRAVRGEHDVVRRDEEDRVRDWASRGRARLHGEDVRRRRHAVRRRDVEGRRETGTRKLRRYLDRIDGRHEPADFGQELIRKDRMDG